MTTEMFIEKLKAGHKTITDRIEATTRLCDCATPIDAETLSEARWALARLMTEHISFEEKMILAPAEGHADPSVRDQGRACRKQQADFYDKVIAHATLWTAAKIQADWASYRFAMAAMHVSILARIKWAEQMLYPLEAVLSGEVTPPKQNWVRPLWSIKDGFSAPQKNTLGR